MRRDRKWTRFRCDVLIPSEARGVGAARRQRGARPARALPGTPPPQAPPPNAPAGSPRGAGDAAAAGAGVAAEGGPAPVSGPAARTHPQRSLGDAAGSVTPRVEVAEMTRVRTQTSRPVSSALLIGPSPSSVPRLLRCSSPWDPRWARTPSPRPPAPSAQGARAGCPPASPGVPGGELCVARSCGGAHAVRRGARGGAPLCQAGGGGAERGGLGSRSDRLGAPQLLRLVSPLRVSSEIAQT